MNVFCVFLVCRPQSGPSPPMSGMAGMALFSPPMVHVGAGMAGDKAPPLTAASKPDPYSLRCEVGGPMSTDSGLFMKREEEELMLATPSQPTRPSRGAGASGKCLLCGMGRCVPGILLCGASACA
jgi:hypothetical protein